MIISNKHKFIYFSNGKVASTSLNKLLSLFHDSELNGLSIENLFGYSHVPPAIIKSFYKKIEWDNFFKFSFVRNPYDWIISCYLYKYRLMYRVWLKKCITHPFFLFHLVRRYRSYVLNSRKSVFDLQDIIDIKERLKTSRAMYFEDSLFQCNYTHDLDGKKLVNYFGKFEMLNEDLIKVSKEIGIKFDRLPYMNRNRKDITYSLTPESIDYIYDFWQKDFDLLEYGKGLPQNISRSKI